MIHNKRTYQKLLIILLFTTFSWVVISDLVNMHLRVIYDIHLFNDNQFIKPAKDDSKDYVKIKCCKSLLKDKNFVNVNIIDIKYVTYVYTLHTKDLSYFFSGPEIQYNALRAPPSII